MPGERSKEAVALAALADTDPRTAAKWLNGGPINRSRVRMRLEEAAKKLGLEQEVAK